MIERCFVLCLLLVGLPAASAYAAAPPGTPALAASYDGESLHIHGPPGARVQVLSSAEKTVHDGVIGADGRIVFADKGLVDPMQRVVAINGVRQSLSDLFPAVELMTVLPRTVTLGLPVGPYIRAVHRGTDRPVAGLTVTADIVCKGADAPFRLGRLTTSAVGVAVSPTRLVVPQIPVSDSCNFRVRAAGASVSQAIQVWAGGRLKLLLTTNKPIYRSGEVVHVRGLVLDAVSGKPKANIKGTLYFVDNRKGHRRLTVQTNAYGVLHADVTIPGGYSGASAGVVLSVGSQSAAKQIKLAYSGGSGDRVKLRLLTPALKVGQPIMVEVEVATPYGGIPGIPAQVPPSIDVTLTMRRGNKVLVGTQSIPSVGSVVFEGLLDSEPGKELLVEARAKRGKRHFGNARFTVPAASDTLTVFAVPESGTIVPGLDNGVWIVTANPDGTPVVADVALTAGGPASVKGGSQVTAKTDRSGIGFVRMSVPAKSERLHVVATSAKGRKEWTRKVRKPNYPALLQISSGVVAEGQTMKLNYTTAEGEGLAHFELWSRGRVFEMTSVPLLQGRATVDMTIPKGVGGTIRLTTWHRGKYNRVAGDSRTALVTDPRDLTIVLTPNKATFKPGETATVGITVTDAKGSPVAAAVDLVALEPAFREFGLASPGAQQAAVRLGTVWNSVRAAPSTWLREGLLQSKDHRRLGILAAATRPSRVKGYVKDTTTSRRFNAYTAFLPGIEQRVGRIAKSLKRYYRASKSRKGKGVTLKALVKLGLVKPQDTVDAWLRPLSMQLVPSLECGNTWVRLTSAGADGVSGKGMDPTANGSFRGYFKKAKRCKAKKVIGGSGGMGMSSSTPPGRMGHFYGARKRRVMGGLPTFLASSKAIVTDAQGKASWTIPLPKGTIRWVVQAKAVSKAGGLGGGEVTLKVEPLGTKTLQ